MKIISMLVVFLLSSFNLNAQQSPFGELKNSFISSGYGISKGGGFIVKSSIAEPLIGHSVSVDSRFVIDSGFLKKNVDLIYFNGLE